MPDIVGGREIVAVGALCGEMRIASSDLDEVEFDRMCSI